MVDRTTYTSSWDEVGTMRVRRWPSSFGGKRPIKVAVQSWKGVSLGAKHIDVTVEEAKKLN
jgi:hypothetical protein